MDIDFSTNGYFVCKVCSVEKTFKGTKAFNQHYKQHHDPLSYYQCNQGGCLKLFKDKTCMIRHITSTHRDLVLSARNEPRPGPSYANLPQPDLAASSSAQSDDDVLSVGLEDDQFHPPSPTGSATSSQVQPAPSLQKQVNDAAVEVLLGLRSTASLTGKAIERFEDGCFQMVQKVCSSIKELISKRLLEHGLSAEDTQGILEGIDSLKDPFEKLKTIDDQLKYFNKEFGLVIPQEKFLDSRLDNRLDPESSSYVQTQVVETFQYIPIIETLTSILKDKKIRSKIFEDHSSSDGVLRSYQDGSHCKEHPYVKKFKNVILILLYYDELEIANSLGSKTIIHKLAAFFFQILNLPPEFSSQLSTIFLLALAYADDLKKDNAMNKVLTPFRQEMKKLSSDEGVLVDLDGEPFVLRAVLVALTADTAAAHDVLGFLAPAGARHFCRECMISRAEVRADANARGAPRTKEMHDRHVQEVSRNSKLSTQNGVKRDCPLNQIPFFHCVENNAFDAFHDFSEVVIPFDIKLVLRHYIIKQKKFSVQDFNGKVASFDYGFPDAKNKPSPNFTTDMLYSGGSHLKQTGSQLWCLLRALPFLLFSFVGEKDEYLELIFMLQDITQIIFAFEVRPEDIDRLEILIAKHNESFQKLFVDSQNASEETMDVEEEDDGDGEITEEEEEEVEDDISEDSEDHEENESEETEEETLEETAEEEQAETSNSVRRKQPKKVYNTNKLHQETHYPNMIRKYGPAVRMWCAKFEGRLQIFRQHSAICCNFKNPPKTHAQMFQLSNVQAFSQALDRPIDFQKQGECMNVSISSHRAALLRAGLQDIDEITCCTYAILNGEEYRRGLFVSLPESTKLNPVFALIKDVIVTGKAVYLVVMPWRNCGLDGRLNTFRVTPEENDEIAAINALRLANFRCMAPWTVGTRDVFLSMRTILM